MSGNKRLRKRYLCPFFTECGPNKWTHLLLVNGKSRAGHIVITLLNVSHHVEQATFQEVLSFYEMLIKFPVPGQRYLPIILVPLGFSRAIWVLYTTVWLTAVVLLMSRLELRCSQFSWEGGEKGHWQLCQSDCAWGMVFLTFVWKIKTTIRYEQEKVSVPAIRQQRFGILFDDILCSAWSKKTRRPNISEGNADDLSN